MGCNRCGPGPLPCTCIPGSSLVPQPFYAGGNSAAENHTQNVYINQFSYGISFTAAWNIPGCGSAAIITIDGTLTVPVGAYIWHTQFGYFEIVSFDTRSQQLTIQNPCLTGNADPGTQVPACTVFAITPPPCCDNLGQSGVFVALDFTAPEDDTCLDITVTSQDGLSTGNNVQIGTGIYYLSEIKPNNVITICNTGDGLVPGTPVIAQNAFGQYQYPLNLLQTSTCDQTAVTQGKLVVCDGIQTKPLTGGANNYVPAFDAATQTVTLQPVTSILSSVCTNAEYGAQIADASFVFTGSGTVGTQYSLASITMPSDGYNYLIQWTISATVLMNYEPTNGNDTAPGIHEIHMVPNGIGVGANQYKCGRANFIVYNIYKFGGGAGPVPTPTFPFITGDLPPDTVAYSAMYNTQEISTYFVRPGSGQTENPVIIYRCWRGQNWGTGVMNIRFMTAGRATLWRI